MKLTKMIQDYLNGLTMLNAEVLRATSITILMKQAGAYLVPGGYMLVKFQLMSA